MEKMHEHVIFVQDSVLQHQFAKSHQTQCRSAVALDVKVEEDLLFSPDFVALFRSIMAGSGKEAPLGAQALGMRTRTHAKWYER